MSSSPRRARRGSVCHPAKHPAPLGAVSGCCRPIPPANRPSPLPGLQKPFRMSLFPRLARLGLNDRTRLAGYIAIPARRLTLMRLPRWATLCGPHRIGAPEISLIELGAFAPRTCHLFSSSVFINISRHAHRCFVFIHISRHSKNHISGPLFSYTSLEIPSFLGPPFLCGSSAEFVGSVGSKKG